MALSNIHFWSFPISQAKNLRQDYSETTGKNLSYNTTNAAFNPQDEIDAFKESLKKNEDSINKTFYG